MGCNCGWTSPVNSRICCKVTAALFRLCFASLPRLRGTSKTQVVFTLGQTFSKELFVSALCPWVACIHIVQCSHDCIEALTDDEQCLVVQQIQWLALPKVVSFFSHQIRESFIGPGAIMPFTESCFHVATLSKRPNWWTAGDLSNLSRGLLSSCSSLWSKLFLFSHSAWANKQLFEEFWWFQTSSI